MFPFELGPVSKPDALQLQKSRKDNDPKLQNYFQVSEANWQSYVKYICYKTDGHWDLLAQK